jgi:hypothetical protein
MLIWLYPVKKSLGTPEIEDEKHPSEVSSGACNSQSTIVLLTSEK